MKILGGFMNKIKKLFLTSMLLVACFIFIPKESLASDFTGSNVGGNQIVPYATARTKHGVSRLDIYNGGKSVTWSARPYTSKSYTFKGLVSVTFKDNTTQRTVVSGSGKGGSAVSGSLYFNKKIKAASFMGEAYTGDKLYITLPLSETYN
jgi:hypothetical protein